MDIEQLVIGGTAGAAVAALLFAWLVGRMFGRLEEDFRASTGALCMLAILLGAGTAASTIGLGIKYVADADLAWGLNLLAVALLLAWVIACVMFFRRGYYTSTASRMARDSRSFR